jgi:hypothetical protein
MLLVTFIIRTRVLEENKTGNDKGGAEWETKAAKRAKTRSTNRRSLSTPRNRKTGRTNSRRQRDREQVNAET